MQLIKEVKSIEPKRAFVFSQIFTSKNMRKKSVKENLVKVNKETFEDDLLIMKKKMQKFSEKKLDKIIGAENKKRLNVYNRIQWYVGVVNVDEIGMWRAAGGIPESWTKRILEETAGRVQRELIKKDSKFKRVRAIKVVPKMIKSKNILKKEEYLNPIILPNEEIPSFHRGMSKADYLLDDGNMRALAFTISGDKKIKAFIGIKKIN